MDWLCRWTTAEPDLARWEQYPFSVNVEQGPRPRDNQDNHERVVLHEPPGPPCEDARRLGDAILRFDVFPPTMLTPVLRRTPIELGDTVGLRYRFVPSVDLFFAARVNDEAGTAPDQQITRVFRIALGRRPSITEMEWCQDLLKRQAELYQAEKLLPQDAARKALVHLCQTLFNTSEFLYAH